MDINPANQQLLRWYGKCYHSLNETMLLDMIKPQVQNKTPDVLSDIKDFNMWHMQVHNAPLIHILKKICKTSHDTWHQVYLKFGSLL